MTGTFRMRHPEGARLQRDTAPVQWIAERLLPWGAEAGTRVCAIAPTGYDAYLRVLHRVPVGGGTPAASQRWADVASRTGRRVHPAVQFQRFGWSDSPEAGSLDREQAALLAAVLHDWTTTPCDCWLAVWAGHGLLASGGVAVSLTDGERAGAHDRQPRRLEPPPDLTATPTFSLPAREYYLYHGPVDIIPQFEYLPGHLQTPNMWWPDDRAWFVATEVDFDSTVVACSHPCAAAVLDSGLEVVEVRPDTRLDLAGDTLNP